MTKEFNNFSKLAEQLIKVPHSLIKEKLDAEKQAKKKKKEKRHDDRNKNHN